MRTDDEIVDRIHERETEDHFGFETLDLMSVLPFSSAREFLKPEATVETFGTPNDRTREVVLKTMSDYMAFAWDKALDHRGVSAGRSVAHFRSWVWLLGDEDFAAINRENYPQYGAPVLKAVCERFGFLMPDSEDAGRMAAGLPCRPDCREGCGT